MSVELPDTITLALEDIKPYENNPRKITAEAVAAVKESISLYGYVQPIMVDKQNVVIVGHTRLAALKELKVKEVPVYVFTGSEDKAREYRLVDNRTSELSEWDHQALVSELREWDQALLSSYFPDVDLEVGQLTDVLVNQQDVDDAVAKVTAVKEAQATPLTTVVCPSCFHNFKVKAASLPGLTGADIDELAARSRE